VASETTGGSVASVSTVTGASAGGLVICEITGRRVVSIRTVTNELMGSAAGGLVTPETTGGSVASVSTGASAGGLVVCGITGGESCFHQNRDQRADGFGHRRAQKPLLGVLPLLAQEPALRGGLPVESLARKLCL